MNKTGINRYWNNRLENFELDGILKNGKSDIPSNTREYKSEIVNTSNELFERINFIAPTDKSKFLMLLSTLGAFIQQVENKSSSLICVPPFSEKEENILSKKTIPILDSIDDFTIKDLLFSLSEKLKEDFKNIDYLKDTIWNSQLNSTKVGMYLKQIQKDNFSPLYLPSLQFIFDITDKISLEIKYDPNLYSCDYLKTISERYFIWLDYVLANKETKLKNCRLITKDEEERIKAFNQNIPTTTSEKGVSLSKLFENQVSVSSGKGALICGEKKLTYGELNKKSNQLARIFQKRGVQKGDVVAVYFERSAEAIVSIMATLKMGGVYLPISPQFPKKRIEYMLSLAKAKLLVTDRLNSKKSFSFDGVELDINEQEIEQEIDTNIDIEASIDDTAYCIFTSGSTGNPKGVLVSHESVINLIDGLKEKVYSKLGNELRVAMLASHVFDASVQQIFGSLLQGHTLFLAKKDECSDGKKLLEFFNNNKIELSDGTPTHFRLLVKELENESELYNLKSWILAGEELSKELVALFYQKVAKDISLFNMYGPTETCVDSTYYPIDRNALEDLSFIPIGYPLPNERIYITNKNGHLMPIGITGEICIAGKGLSKGYIGDTLMTNEKFRKDWIEGEERIYRTGDLGQWLPNGEIKFIGRKDTQIKLRGYRIEVSEIESRLKKHEGVEDAVITFEETNDNNDQIVAHIVPGEKQAFTVKKIVNAKNSSESISKGELYEMENGVSMYFNNKAEAKTLYKEIFELRTYHKNGIKLPKNATIFDIGANVGTFTVFSMLSFQNPKIYAFEPIKPTFELLQKNVNSYKGNVELFNIGISDKEGEAVFDYYPNATTLSGMESDDDSIQKIVKTFIENTAGEDVKKLRSNKIEELVDHRLVKEKHTCKLKPVSQLIRELQIKHIDLLKIDVENAELEVLNGVENNDWLKIDQVIIEVYDVNERLEFIKSKFEKLGYRVSVLQSDELERTNLYDVYCIREKTIVEGNITYDYSNSQWYSESTLISSIRNMLSENLPDYMIPSKFLFIEEMPITTSGKLDYKALKNKIKENDSKKINLSEPTNDIEKKLQNIWSEILKIEKEKIGVQSNFLELGGHSLKMIFLSNKIKKVFGVSIDLPSLFEKGTIRSMGQEIMSRTSEKNLPFKKATDKKSYPLSSAQKRLFFLSQYEKKALTYNIPQFLRLNGAIDIERLETSFAKIINRHEILRTQIEINEEIPVQKIVPSLDFNIEIYENSENNINDVINRFVRPFDVSRAPLIRVGLLKLSKEDHILLTDMHHMVSDAVTQSILIDELGSFYGNKEKEPVQFQYKDYSEWQNSKEYKSKIDAQKRYWLKEFSETPEPINLPTDYERPEDRTKKGNTIGFTIAQEQISELDLFSKKEKVTMFSVLFSTIVILLNKISSQKDIVIGTPVSGRVNDHLTSMVGVFINSLALRISLEDDFTFNELVQVVNKKTLDSLKNQEYNYEDLIDDLKLERDRKRNPLFDVMFNYQDVESSELVLPGLKLSDYLVNDSVAKFDLTFHISKKGTNFFCSLNYATDVFEKNTIERFIDYLQHIILKVSENQHTNISNLSILSKEEKNEIIQFNDTKRIFNKDETILDLYLNQLLRNPHKNVLVLNDEALTYKELDAKANQLANYIENKFKNESNFIAISLDRSFEMFISMLAVLKLGKAFVPIDPNNTINNRTNIIEEASINLVLTTHKYSEEFSKIKQVSLVVLDDQVSDFENFSSERDRPNVTVESSAYVIFTSGSTGKPKGVIVEHHSIANYLNWANETYLDNGKGDLPFYTSIAFDLTLTSILLPLVTGNEIIIYNDDDPALVEKILTDDKVDIIKMTPSHLRILDTSTAILHKAEQSKLKKIIVGGEMLHNELAKSINEKYKNKIEIYNEYGPTEATVGCSIHKYSPTDVGFSVPIGKPISNTQLYVLDAELLPVPKNSYGELYVAGEGVARGYLNREELTESKFLENPYEKNSIMYKTGDVVKWSPEGIIFIGRKDEQVKIRGHRVELGHVENTIAKINTIKKCCVLAKENKKGDSQLIAYIAIDGDFKRKEIENELSTMLSSYMIPELWITISDFPLTKNGKIDKKKLLTLENYDREEVKYEAPQNEIEKKLVEIWEELLEVENIGVFDEFFKLGGNSLKIVFLSNKIMREFKVTIEVVDLFDLRNIRNISKEILSREKKVFYEIEPTKENDTYILSSAQKRLYFLHEYDKTSIAYNIPQFYIFKGELKVELVENAFKLLIERHEVLRTTIELINDQPVQRIASEIAFNLEYFETEASRLNDLIKEFVRPFNLSKAPFFRVGLAKVSSSKYILLFDIHHLISDRITQSILIKEFLNLYEGNQIEPHKIHYKDYAVWQNSLANKQRVAIQKQYWLHEFKDIPQLLDLPLDHLRPQIRKKLGNSINFTIDSNTYTSLNNMVAEQGVTMFSFLLGSFVVLLNKLTGQEDIVVGTSVSGRAHPSLENLVGVFTNSLALRNKIEENVLFREFIKEVNHRTMSAINNQEYNYEDLIDDLDLKRDSSRNPLFDVMFEYQDSLLSKPNVNSIEVESYILPDEISKFDLTFRAHKSKDKLELSFNYATDIFKRETISRFVMYFKILLNQLVESDTLKLSHYTILSLEEKQKLNRVNSYQIDYPNQSNLVELFEEQVKLTPENHAVESIGEVLTYRELNSRSNQLAKKLLEVGDDSAIIGLQVDRSVNMVIGILGILKAGKAYLPIATDFPIARVNKMLEGNVTLVVTQRKFSERSRMFSCTSIFIDDIIEKETQAKNLSLDIKNDELAYCIFTSGSTGEPKGVLVEHKSVINLVYGLKNTVYKGISEDKLKVGLFASYVFDASIQQIFVSLLMGHSLVIANEKERSSGDGIKKFLNENKIQVSDGTPTHFRLFLEALDSNDTLNTLEMWLIAGEQLSKRLVERFYSKISKEIKLHNMYGPTETCVDSLFYSINREKLSHVHNMPIGGVLPNERVYIADGHGNILPTGIIGEICIAGDGLARGYLEDASLTRNKFKENWIKGEDRVYCTGDLGKLLPDGTVEFINRRDNQIKLRGYRIELGEIEYLLKKNINILECVIDFRDYNGEMCLIAYYVSKNKFKDSELRDYISNYLPNYMVPSYFVELEEMPLAISGKLDKSALPNPNIKVNKEIILPCNSMEEELLDIWAATLNIDKTLISTDISFLELGAHSLMAIQIANNIKQLFEIEVALIDLFKNPTISEQAKFIEVNSWISKGVENNDKSTIEIDL